MQYPKLSIPPTSRQTVDVFGGYNHNLRIGDGEFCQMRNMSSDHYPVLSPRAARGIHATGQKLQGLIARDILCHVDGANFAIGDTPIEMGLSTACATCPLAHKCPQYAAGKTVCNKQLISIGAYVIILPDKKWVNMATWDSQTVEFGDIEFEKKPVNIEFTLCKADGTAYTDIAQQEPTDPADGQLWLDTSADTHCLKQWSAETGMWYAIATTYVKLSLAGIGKGFERYDGIRIEGLDKTAAETLNGTTVIWEKGDDYLVVRGLIDQTVKVSTNVRLARLMPWMDFVIESGNRLWGCKYGKDLYGNFVNEIYCSKLGDFKNWYCFQGISTDSYVASIGADGPFTGAVCYQGRPLFFKENCMIEVYGSYPAAYQVQTTPCQGVQSGCEKSLAIVSNVLYYKSRGGVCAFDGSLPVQMGRELGSVQYENAVSGGCGRKYYISMQDTDTQDWHLFVYDTSRGLWHREDDLQAVDFCAYRNELYCLSADHKRILTMLGSGEKSTETVDWQVETGQIGLSLPDRKYVSRLTVRLSLEQGSEAVFYARYDEGHWEHLFTLRFTDLRSFSVPIRPKRCDHMRLRIEGSGGAKVYSLTKTVERGSDIG